MDNEGWSWMFPPEPHQEPRHCCGCALVPWPGCTPPQGFGEGQALVADSPRTPPVCPSEPKDHTGQAAEQIFMASGVTQL